MAKTKAAGPQISEFFNGGPKFTLKLPTQQRSNMAAAKAKAKARSATAKTVANRKRKGGHKKHHHHKRNTATSSAAPKVIYKTRTVKARANKAKAKSKRNSARRTGVLTRLNPFGGKGIGGLHPMDLVGGAVGILVDGVIQLFVPAGWIGLGLRGVGAIGMVRFLPRSLGPAAGLTAGAMVVKDGANRLFNVSGLLNSTVTRFVPLQLAAVPATGMSGLNPMGVNFGRRMTQGLRY